MKLQRILFPTDLSEQAEPARDLAYRLARQHGAELCLFHAVLTHAQDFRQLGDLLSDFIDQLEAEATQQLETEAARLREEGSVAQAAVVRGASAFEALMARVGEWQPDLIVMATHGRTGMPRLFLGSVTEKTVRHAPCAVATVRAGATGSDSGVRPGRILVPVDFSDNARRAVAAAQSLAGDEGSLVVQHVVLNPTLAGLAPEARLELFSRDESLPDRIREHMAGWMEGQEFDALVTEADDVAASVVEAAQEAGAEMIVMGTRGRTGIDYFLTGSVAERVVRSSPIPVVTIR